MVSLPQAGSGVEGAALNSLRNFRLQKKKFSAVNSDSEYQSSQEQSGASQASLTSATDLNSSLESPIRQVTTPAPLQLL